MAALLLLMKKEKQTRAAASAPLVGLPCFHGVQTGRSLPHRSKLHLLLFWWTSLENWTTSAVTPQLWLPATQQDVVALSRRYSRAITLGDTFALARLGAVPVSEYMADCIPDTVRRSVSCNSCNDAVRKWTISPILLRVGEWWHCIHHSSLALYYCWWLKRHPTDNTTFFSTKCKRGGIKKPSQDRALDYWASVRDNIDITDFLQHWFITLAWLYICL